VNAITKDEANKFDPNDFEPIKFGFTWETNEDGTDWLYPDYTLGWGVVAWCAKWLVNDEGTPWMFTPEQLRFVLWYYSVDERGRFVYPKGVLQRLKGWGKDPLAAALALVEILGPCRFSHFDLRTGQPIGKAHPSPLVQLAATSASQNNNTMRLFPVMIPKTTEKHFGMKIGAEKISALGGRAIIEVITSSYRSAEGARATFVLMNETHHWVSGNQGHDLYDVIERNLTKAKGGNARLLAITNAYLPGEDSVAERMRDAYEKTVTINPITGKPYAAFAGVYYDTLEAPGNAPLTPEMAPLVVEKIRGDATWLDIETIVLSIVNRQNSASKSRRFWYNQIVSDEEAILSAMDYDACLRPVFLAEGDEIVLGFDGGRTRDATVLIAIRISDKAVFHIGSWWNTDPANQPDWEVPRPEVDGMVDYCFTQYNVLAFFADVRLWESYIDSWSDKYRDKLVIKATPTSAVGYDMSGHFQELTQANERLVSNFADGYYCHDGNAIVRQHVMNTRKYYNKWGLYFTKDSREGNKHNDAWAAILLASLALTKFLESGRRPERKRSGRVHMF
jgi:hypothetical protein